jgi:hypothetical protein
MLKSLSKLFFALMRLISTCYHLLTTFGCWSTPKKCDCTPLTTTLTTTTTITSPNGVKHKQHHQNGYKNGFVTSNGHVKNGYTNGVTTLNGTANGYHHVSNGTETHHQQTNGLSGPKSDQGAAIRPCPITVRPQVPFHMILSNFLCHGTLFFFGHFNDFLRRRGWMQSFEKVERNRDGYPGLYASFATFYVRNIIQRMINMWGHPISSVPAATIEIKERRFCAYNANYT